MNINFTFLLLYYITIYDLILRKLEKNDIYWNFKLKIRLFLNFYINLFMIVISSLYQSYNLPLIMEKTQIFKSNSNI
jgi:hypothetical protein